VFVLNVGICAAPAHSLRLRFPGLQQGDRVTDRREAMESMGRDGFCAFGLSSRPEIHAAVQRVLNIVGRIDSGKSVGA
jgi:hypothetical protein